MDNLSFMFLDNFSLSDDLPETNLAVLEREISRKSYPGIYAALRQYGHPFSPKGAFRLLSRALYSELTLKAIAAILERCPPVAEFLYADEIRGYDIPLGAAGLLEQAACKGRADVLKLLLDRGADPNLHPGYDFSPLEAALEGLSLECVEVLAARADLRVAWTPRLLDIWSRADPEPPLLEFCLQAVARRLPGQEWPCLAPIPIPERMTVLEPARNRNWALLERVCRERAPIPPGVGRKAAGLFPRRVDGDERDACAAALHALLASCPGLLRGETACRVLLRLYLQAGPESRRLLRPWVERLRARRVSMDREDWQAEGAGPLLERWRKLLPQGPTLVVDREKNIFTPPADDLMAELFGSDERAVPTTPEDVARILDACPVRGRARPGKLSALARGVITLGSPGLLAELFLPGGLLAGEDPRALAEASKEDDCPRMNRAAILAHVRREENYEL